MVVHPKLFERVIVCAMCLFSSCQLVDEKPIDVMLMTGAAKVLIEGVTCDEWQVSNYFHKDYQRYGHDREINLLNAHECKASDLKLLYYSDKEYGSRRVLRVSGSQPPIKFLRFLLDDPLVVLFNSYIFHVDNSGCLTADAYFVNIPGMVWWSHWWVDLHRASPRASRMPKPDRKECKVVKLPSVCRPIQTICNDKTGVLLIAENEAPLSRVIGVIAELSKRFGCNIYLTCSDYEFDKWMAADFPEKE